MPISYHRRGVFISVDGVSLSVYFYAHRTISAAIGENQHRMGVAERFRGFLANINLTPTQQADGETKANGVTAALHKHFYGEAHSFTSFFVGSYGKKTSVRPPRDVDVFFVLPPIDFYHYDGLSGNKQSRLLQDVKNILKPKYPATDLYADGQVVRVPFLSFGVEVVPAFKQSQSDTEYLICDTHDGGQWKHSSPWSEIVYVDAADERSKGNAVALIKMVKTWQRVCNVPLKSLELELLAVKFLQSWEYFDQSAVLHDWMVRDFFNFMRTQANEFLSVPGTGERLFLWDNWLSRAETAYARADEACDDEQNARPFSAHTNWQKIFGDAFPF